MNDIAGIPYTQAQFDKDGNLVSAVSVPAGVTDVLIVSHGWNNNAAEAEGLYRGLFTNFAAVAQPTEPADRKFAIVGVIWPSKRFDEMVAAAATADAQGGSASLAEADEGSDALLIAKLDSMREFFKEPGQEAVLAGLKALIPELKDSGTARADFVKAVRSLLDPSAANDEDSSRAFFADDGNEIMKRLMVDEEDLDDALTNDGGSASLPLGVGVVAGSTGGAAGLLSFLSGIKSAAMNVLNFATYYEMKARAGTVGKNGVGPLVDTLAPSVERIHLVGHSFGGRVVTAAAANSKNAKIASMSLLQTAFSHNGFSKTKNGFFRDVVDSGRVNGPIVVTHTPNDKAVGIAYPLASRINRDSAAKLGDKNDKFGGLGRNGAQQMNAGETEEGTLQSVGGAYAFEKGKFFNLESSQFIKGHSDITGKEVAYAIRKALA